MVLISWIFVKKRLKRIGKKVKFLALLFSIQIIFLLFNDTIIFLSIAFVLLIIGVVFISVAISAFENEKDIVVKPNSILHIKLNSEDYSNMYPV